MNLPIKEQKRLKNKYGNWALVTGSTSGIGLEFTKQLAASGFNIIINSRKEEDLIQLRNQLETANKIKAVVVAADLSTEHGVAMLISISKNYPVGLFIMSAGFGTSGLFLNSNNDDELTMLRLNCEAVLKLTLYFSKLFAGQQRGGIILLSSIVAFQGVPYAANYAATKAYVQTLAEALAIELKPNGVDVLAAAPGPVKSNFESRANMKMNLSMEANQVAIPILKALGRKKDVWPGFLSKLLIGSLSTAPRWGKIRIMKTIMKGMTQHQINNA
jgi:uncharacterized protein